MICKKCKTIIPDTARVCGNCGQAVKAENEVEIMIDVELTDDFEIIEDLDEIHEFKSRYIVKEEVDDTPGKSAPSFSGFSWPDLKAIDQRYLIGGGAGIGLLLLVLLISLLGKDSAAVNGQSAAEDTTAVAEAASLTYADVSEVVYIEALGLMDEFCSEDYVMLLAADFKEALIAAYGEDFSGISGENGCDVMISLADVIAKKRRIAALSDSSSSAAEILLEEGMAALYSLACEAAYGLAVDDNQESDFYVLNRQIYIGFDSEGFDLPGISSGGIGDAMNYLYDGIIASEHADNLKDSWKYQRLTHSFFKDIASD